MKKIFAILLLVTHLFNIAGYQFVFNYFIDRSDVLASQKFDEHLYADGLLTEVKIPLNLPYMQDMAAYERVDGNVEVDGIHYNYVKRKISGDTLYILCQPNYTKTKLVNEKIELVGGVNDLPVNKQLPAPSVKKLICQADYNLSDHAYHADTRFTIIPSPIAFNSSKLPAVFPDVAAQPPKPGC